MIRLTIVFLCGVLLASIVFYAVGTRYTLHVTGVTIYRLDTWTGRTWAATASTWRPVSEELP
jgi:hypothetical protein